MDDSLSSSLRCCLSAPKYIRHFFALVIWRIMGKLQLPFNIFVSLVNSPLTEVEDRDLIDELVYL